MPVVLILITAVVLTGVGIVAYKHGAHSVSARIEFIRNPKQRSDSNLADCANPCMEECGFPSFSYCFPKKESGEVSSDTDRRCSIKEAIFAFSKYIREMIGADDAAIIVVDHKKGHCALLKKNDDDIEMVEVDYENALIKSLVDLNFLAAPEKEVRESLIHDCERNEFEDPEDEEARIFEKGFRDDENDDTNELRLLNELYHLATKRFKKNLDLRRMSEKDGLTGLYNHRYFQERLETELHKAVARKGALSVLMIDIDHFKRVNDEYGHQMGDHVLVELSEMLKKKLREKDVLARYGGEEFAVILIGINKTTALKVAERMRSGVDEHEFATDFPEKLSITISIGVSDLSACRDKRSLVELADKALFSAKEGGRNMVVG